MKTFNYIEYMKMQTQIIIRKNGYYLIGHDEVFGDGWSRSPWDACGTRDREEARDVARETGGITMLFNPVVGQLQIF